jgi:hypothetical protein
MVVTPYLYIAWTCAVQVPPVLGKYGATFCIIINIKHYKKNYNKTNVELINNGLMFGAEYRIILAMN